jgi:hypothetical protein
VDQERNVNVSGVAGVVTTGDNASVSGVSVSGKIQHPESAQLAQLIDRLSAELEHAEFPLYKKQALAEDIRAVRAELEEPDSPERREGVMYRLRQISAAAKESEGLMSAVTAIAGLLGTAL